MEVSERLTPPQRKLLTELCTAGRASVSPTYAPAKNLVAGGYAFWKTGRYNDWLEPTGVGRAKYEDLKREATP